MADGDQQRNSDSDSGDPLNESSEAFSFQSREQYTLAYQQTQHPSLPDSATRILIMGLLASANIMVSTSPLKRDDIEETFGEMPEFFLQAAFHSGLVWAWAYFDDTTKTGEIKVGEAVVFDTVTGRCVTGINSSWAAAEYKVVGKAWKAHNVVGFAKIPITLNPAPTAPGYSSVSGHVYIYDLGPPIIGMVTHRPVGMSVLPEETVSGTIEIVNGWDLDIELGLLGAASYVTEVDGGDTYYLLDRLICAVNPASGGGDF